MREAQYLLNLLGWINSTKQRDPFFIESQEFIEYAKEYANSNSILYQGWDILNKSKPSNNSSITLKEFAEMLNDREYKYPQFTKAELQIAKDNGFVIVYGCSDDLMEFDGAIKDEADCFNGGMVWFDKDGVIDPPATIGGKCITALWCDKNTIDENGYITSWTYKTYISHETFMIYEDEEPYCRGIVFKIDDV